MKKLIYLLALLTLLLLPVQPVFALGPSLEGRVVLGQNFTLKAGETLAGDLVIIGGQAVVERGAVVQGDTVVIGGNMPSWSPNDQQIAFSDCRGSDCGVLKAGSLGGDGGTMIVKELGTNPAWSPDGNKIVYQADVDSIKQLFVVNADGSGKKQVTSGTASHVGAAWSPDGGTIFYRSPEGGSWGIWKMNADGSGQVKLKSDVEPVDWAYERLAVTR